MTDNNSPIAQMALRDASQYIREAVVSASDSEASTTALTAIAAVLDAAGGGRTDRLIAAVDEMAAAILAMRDDEQLRTRVHAATVDAHKTRIEPHPTQNRFRWVCSCGDSGLYVERSYDAGLAAEAHVDVRVTEAVDAAVEEARRAAAA